MTDFDYCFESELLGNRQAVILHKYHLGGDIWHVCTVDSNNYYDSTYYRLDRSSWTFERVSSDVAEDQQCTPT